MGLTISNQQDKDILNKWSVNNSDTKDSFNITVASWPGVGSTTLSLILAYTYGLKYFYSGAVFRYFSEKLGYSAEGKDYNRNEDKYGSYLDSLVDDFSKVLLEQGGYVIGTKPLGYIIDRKDTFRIFLYADVDSRVKRAIGDGRESADTVKIGLLTRQKVAGDRYRRIYGFDWDDMDVLKKSHECVLDTSNMQISDEVKIIVEKIKKKHDIEPTQTFIFGGLTPPEIKTKALKHVQENDLELTTQEAVKRMYEHFKVEIDKKPQFIIDIFKGA